MQILTTAGVGMDIVRDIFSLIDTGIYSLISLVTNLLFNISRFTVTSSFVQLFISRIYIIVSIYMIFKLAISLLNGITNPDSITDKQAGMQKIIPRVLISLAMLILVPTIIFPKLIEWQDPIIRAIPKVMLGRTGEIKYSLSDNVQNTDDTIGNQLSSSTLQAFITPSADCDAAVDDPPNNITILDETIMKAKCSKDYKLYAYDYQFGISTVFGIVMLVVMVGYCFDIAIRALKMCILQVVAPIPIISYVDPKSQKDGAFGNWIKTFISTYIDLFIKLALVYFVLFFVTEIFNWNSTAFSFGDDAFSSVGGGTKTMVMVFLVLGLLFFLRQAPKFIMDILGIKGGAGNWMGMSGILAGTAALAGGAGLFGAASAAADSMNNYAEAAAQGKQASSAWSRGRDIAANMRGEEKGRTATQRMVDFARMRRANAAGLGDATRQAAQWKERRETAESNALEAEQKANDEASKNLFDISTTDDTGRTVTRAMSYNDIKDYVEAGGELNETQRAKYLEAGGKIRDAQAKATEYRARAKTYQVNEEKATSNRDRLEKSYQATRNMTVHHVDIDGKTTDRGLFGRGTNRLDRTPGRDYNGSGNESQKP